VYSEEVLWQCTTCGACEHQCPVGIEHLPILIGARRGLVSNGDAPDYLGAMYNNLERRSSIWGLGYDQRAKFVASSDLETFDPAKHDVLVWLGCAGSFDADFQKSLRSLFGILRAREVKFGVLSKERCTGDPAKRTGNEYLYQELANGNIEDFKATGVKKILTSCPHCVKTIGDDYKKVGYKVEIVHSSVFVEALLRDLPRSATSGSASLSGERDKVTFHDPCYLGRYQGTVDEPRALLTQCGADISEPERNRENPYCCGASRSLPWMYDRMFTVPARALLISTYDLGHQPFGLASPAAWLGREGMEVLCVDLAKEKLAEQAILAADLVAFHLPMHTATRLAAPVIQKVRALSPTVRICAYGLYAPLNEAWLGSLGVDDVFGGEFEPALAAVARQVLGLDVRPAHGGRGAETPVPARLLPKLQFLVPDRSTLPPLHQYATLQLGTGQRRVAGYTEASRGCRHLCRHCPVVPVYQGQFRVVQPDVVLADIAAQVAAGAEHITFGDPDFFNGPTHAMRLVEALHEAYPALSYDVTIKVEHLLRHRDLLPRLRDTGCVFVTSAVESIDDRVLALLEKGHTRADFLEAVALCRAASFTLVPTFVTFHPWMTLTDYCELVDTIAALDLVDHVAPIQLAIRLLIPAGSRLLEVEDVKRVAGVFDGTTLSYRWVHPDPRVDALHHDVSEIVGRRLTSNRREAFAAISLLAHDRAGLPGPHHVDFTARGFVPHFDEPWYCCAEPNPEQLLLV